MCLHSVWAVLNGQLWFGTADGRLCRFAKSEEEHAYLDDTAAIAAYWRTPTLPLSDWSRFKTVRDVIPTLMPHSRSGATVQYENENGAQLALSRNMDLFSFRTLDFSRFSFRCIPGAVTYRTRWKQHRSPLFAVRIGTTGRMSRLVCSRSPSAGHRSDRNLERRIPLWQSSNQLPRAEHQP